MANPQPTDAHGIIAHEIQENLIIRGFTERRLKVIYLILRLSWGCSLKAWKYDTYKDFEVIGIHKSDVASILNYLRNNKVITWVEKYNLLMFNKDYDQWKIPIAKKSDPKMFDTLIHQSLKNTNEVSNLLTMLVKNQRSLEKTNEVSNFGERFKTGTPTHEQVSDMPKESIITYITNNNIGDEKFEFSSNIFLSQQELSHLTKCARSRLNHYIVCLQQKKAEGYKASRSDYEEILKIISEEEKKK